MERGQLYTLEGLVAGLLVVLALLFVLQATSVTPQSVGGGSEEGIDQQRSQVDSALQSIGDSQLKQTVLYWDPGAEQFHCTPGDLEFYPGHADTSSCSPPIEDAVPPTVFGEALEHAIDDGENYNVDLAFRTDTGIQRQRLVYQGEPGSGSIQVTRSISIFEDDEFRDVNGERSGTNVSERESRFYAPNTHPSMHLYTVVHVEVVAW
ncbi:MAG: DUF7288 family protein [archaeon]